MNNMNANINKTIKLLVKRKIFKTEEEAIQSLLRDYIMGQIAGLRREIGRFERKYGMSFQQFSDYIHDRSVSKITGMKQKIFCYCLKCLT
jgi:hypothetical protein